MTYSIRKLGLLLIILTPLTASAWGRRGHQIVGETAALVVSSEPNSSFMREHSFDFAYYANVPDFIWKGPSTYAMEYPQHFINIQVFEREFAKHPEIKDPKQEYRLSRKDFDAKYPAIEQKNGRAFWRIRELYAELEKAAKALRDLPEKSGRQRQKLQERWVLVAGVLAHYVGDLSMPLHIDENHDGQMTNQKGIHHYFEDTMVNQLYPGIDCEVNKETLKRWPKFKKENANKDVFQLVYELAQRSESNAPKLLAMDKKSKRENIKKSVAMYHSMIRRQLVDGSLVLAELYSRQLGWTFDDDKFYFFAGTPDYIKPGDSGEPPSAKH